MKKGDCKHFNGTINECCDAGVNYRKLAGEPEFGCMTRLPCLVKYSKERFEPKGGPLAVCDKREEVTPEELANYEAEIKKHSENLMKTMPLIAAMKKEFKGKSGDKVG